MVAINVPKVMAAAKKPIKNLGLRFMFSYFIIIDYLAFENKLDDDNSSDSFCF